MADAIFQPLQFKNLTVKNRIFPLEHLGTSGQLRRFGQPGPHQLGGEVRPRRRRRDHLVVRAGPDRRAGSCRTTRRSTKTSAFPSGARSAKEVHKFDCKYILQLSHGGRQRDVPGIEYPMGKSSTEQGRSAARVRMQGDDEGRHPGDGQRASPKARAARARRASTASSCTAPTAT